MSFNNPPAQDNVAPTVFIVNTVFSVLATIAVACRFTARHMKGVGWWYDDWFALFALVCRVCLAPKSLELTCTDLGLGFLRNCLYWY